jgi:hypothetical protein
MFNMDMNVDACDDVNAISHKDAIRNALSPTVLSIASYAVFVSELEKICSE